MQKGILAKLQEPIAGLQAKTNLQYVKQIRVWGVQTTGTRTARHNKLANL
jgi:hypothetical protein